MRGQGVYLFLNKPFHYIGFFGKVKPLSLLLQIFLPFPPSPFLRAAISCYSDTKYAFWRGGRGYVRRSDPRSHCRHHLFFFALPMILGNLLQQLLQRGGHAHRGQGLSRGLCPGGGGVVLHADDLSHVHPAGPVHGQRRRSFPCCFGAGERERLREGLFTSFLLIGGVSPDSQYWGLAPAGPHSAAFAGPLEICAADAGVPAGGVLGDRGFTFLYNFFASLLRAVGNTVAPPVFLARMRSALTLRWICLFVIWYSALGLRERRRLPCISQGVSAPGHRQFTPGCAGARSAPAGAAACSLRAGAAVESIAS